MVLFKLDGFFFACIATLIGGLCCSDLTRNRFIPYTFEIFTCPPLSFSFIWAVIGLVIYNEELSDECQHEPIGQMLLAWSIIQVICAGPALCIMCCNIFKSN